MLSRCQRYDFAGITPEAIAGTLGEICTREGVEFEPEALQVVARRAGGSLRDAQSLLDRLLASGSPKLTVEIVHSLLGTATDERLLKMLEALAGHDSAAALGLLEQSAAEGVQPAELLSGLIDLIRDAMILAVGGAESMLLAISPRNRSPVEEHRRPMDAPADHGVAANPSGMPGPDARERSRAVAARNRSGSRRPPRRAHVALRTLVERLAALESGAPPRRPETGQRQDASRARPPTPGPPRARRRPTPRRGRAAPIATGRHGTMHAAEAQPGPAADVAPSPARAEVPPDTAAVPATVAAVARSSQADMTRAGAAVRPAGARPVSTAAADDEPGSSAQPFWRRPHARAAGRARGRLGGFRSHRAEASASARSRRGPKLWPDLVKKVGTGLGWKLAQVEPIELEGPDVLVIAARPGYNSTFDECGTPEAQAKIGQALQRLVHRPVKIKYVRRAAEDQGQADSRPNEARASQFAVKRPDGSTRARALRGAARPDGLRRGRPVSRKLRGRR